MLGLQDGRIRFLNKDSLQPIKESKEHKGPVTDIKVNGQLIVSAGGKSLTFWHPTTLTPLYHYRFDKDISFIEMDKEQERVFLFHSKNIGEYSTATNQLTATIQEVAQCSTTHHPYLLIGDAGGAVKIWRMGSYQFKISFQAHSARVKALKCCNYNNNDYLISASATGQVAIWDVLQFLNSVDAVSQDYPLAGLKPLTLVQVRFRILTMDVLCVESKPTKKTTKQKRIQKTT